MFVRLLIAVFLGIPVYLVCHGIGYLVTLFLLSLTLGCFLPFEAVQALALLEYFLAMVHGCLHLVVFVLDEDA